jgi:release factor glutamine methyltransferase
MEIPGEPEDPDAAFVRCLQLFRHYPLQEVGGVWMLLNTAFELNQARRQSMVEGIDPDSPAWTATQDAAAHKANWTANKLRESTGKLWSSYAESDVTARMANMAKASSTFTASAVAKWSASAPATPDWKGLGAAAGRLFSRKPRTSTGSVSGEEYEFHSGPTSPASTYQPGPHSPITPSHSTNPSYGGGLGLVTRGRSDSVQSRSSAVSVGSLQERLSGLASGLTTPREPTQRVTSGPRPLLLSGSARKAQHAPPSPRPRGGSSTGITGGLASPPHHDGGHAGLYRIGSRRGPNGARKGNRQSLGSDYSAPYDSDHSHGSFAQGGLALSAMDRALPAAVPENAIPSPLPSPTPQSASLETPEAPEPISIPTPQISHLTEDDYEHVYEPAEDSFILLDALEADALVLRDAKPALCVEIGSGSGIASTFMGTLLGTGEAFMLSTDINAYAAAATLRTGDANDVTLNPVLANLLDPLESRIAGQIDLLIFNPPYVVTDDDELVATQNGRDIGGAWAGGNLGMAVTDILLERLPTLLAPGGRFYLVAIHQNKPDEIIARMRAAGLECKTVIKRRAGRELLSVIRMIAPGDSRGATPRSSPEASPVPAIQSPLAYTSFTAAAGAGAESASAADPVPAPAPAQVAVKKTEAPQTPPVQTVATPADSETDAGEEEEDYGALLDAYA